MKGKVISYYYIILIVICQVFLGVLGVFQGEGARAVDTNNFYFKSFVGDYYLEKATDGTSKLRVTEEVTAVFPTYNQNKGICRQIPFTNQGGANITIENLTSENLKLTRNGAPEPIYSLEKEGMYYNVCAGDERFVTGEQVYKFEYEFVRVVTEFDGYQELYWDTNGTGAVQRFDSVVARVHFADESVYDGKNWCYVGQQGQKGEGRCTVTEISDGLEFSAKDLGSYENLTFDVLLKPGSFVVPELTKNYLFIVVMVGVGVVCALLIIRRVWKFFRTSWKKMRYYNDIFVFPRYQALDEYSIDEMAAIYIGNKKDTKVAMLLDMIVRKKIKIRKISEKSWALTLTKKAQITPQEELLLQILNGGDYVHKGEEFTIGKYGATQSLRKLSWKLDEKTEDKLLADGLVEKGYKFDIRIGSPMVLVVLEVLWTLLLMGVLFAVAWLVLMDGGTLKLNVAVPGVKMVGEELLVPVVLATIGATAVIMAIFRTLNRIFGERTKAGIEKSRFVDGLKLYIKMAEATRIKILQSVEGADVGVDGVVKLYEKLLPYAVLFGLEKSWMNELEGYYQLDEATEPDWYRNGITLTDMMLFLHFVSEYSRAATAVTASSSSSSSSSSSGSFGGGFSGGGGGGGGFSGR